MKRTSKALPGPCSAYKNGYCSLRAKTITVKDGIARECVKCPRARRR